MNKRLLFLLMFPCTTILSLAQLNQSPVRGNAGQLMVGVIDTLASTILNETRVLNVYLPADYSPDTSSTYPVIYLLDGGVEEDFFHIAGLVKYFTTPWVNRFPKSIVVGIENVNRKRDFTFPTPNFDFLAAMGYDKKTIGETGGSAAFIAFIEKELQPFIHSRYRTNSSRTLIGESLGGLLATEILFNKPALFNTYIIVNPSLWWGSGSMLKSKPAFANSVSVKKLKVYLGASQKAEDAGMYADAQKLSSIFRRYPSSIQLSFDYLPAESHATAIHLAVYNAFKLLYPKP